MRQQIAAANWKMNLTLPEGVNLIDDLLAANVPVAANQKVVLAVPFPYLAFAQEKLQGHAGFATAAQNVSDKKSGAYTGEVSTAMLQSMGITYCIVGHSERRELFGETNQVLAGKVDACLQAGITPIFCCGEPLAVRESEKQNDFVQQQLEESLFHLSEGGLRKLVIAYEPIWAIGTGKTASTGQAQEMHAHLRAVLAGKWGAAAANEIPILYGGSVKANNAAELFAAPDVDGGLVGGASLVAQDFITIMKALKH